MSDLGAVLSRWRISARGDFEGRSIPRLGRRRTVHRHPHDLQRARDALRRARALRAAPSRDEKVILEWNAMFASALLQSGERRYRRARSDLLESLRRTHFSATACGGERRAATHTPARATSRGWSTPTSTPSRRPATTRGSTRPSDVATYLLAHYWDGPVPTSRHPHDGAGLFSISDLVTDLATRPKEIFDGATPSSHAVACRALARLALCRGDASLLVVAQRLVDTGRLAARHPSRRGAGPGRGGRFRPRGRRGRRARASERPHATTYDRVACRRAVLVRRRTGISPCSHERQRRASPTSVAAASVSCPSRASRSSTRSCVTLSA